MEKIDREIYLKEAFRYLPRLIHLLDTNEFHSTYGCFDREYWHYKRCDFACGMNQEYVLPLALFFRHNFPNNPFYNNERIEQLIFAAMDFARTSSHNDGSCDSFYPYERALGAAVFSLYACTEAYLLMGKENRDLVGFFKKRAAWIISHGEKGTLANHHAIAAVALLNVFLITNEEGYRYASEEKVKEVLSLQNQEGWFIEYGGCDPGYLTVTIDFLAKYYKKIKSDWLLEPLKKAVQFCRFFMHPDGSFGGEYGARGTSMFFPHGFEILRPLTEEAGRLADKNLMGLKLNAVAISDDDRIFCHIMYNYIQAYLENCESPLILSSDKQDNFEKLFPEAGLYVRLLAPYYLVLGLKKGGTAKLYKDRELIYNDTGFIGELSNGEKVSSQILDPKRKICKEGGKFVIEGDFYVVKHKLLSPFKNALFRLFLFSFGRMSFSRDLLRGFFQKKLILFKKRAPVQFQRCFELEEKGLRVIDTISYDKKSKKPLIRLKVGADHVCGNSAIANSYQKASLLPWLELGDKLESLKKEGTFTDERIIS